MLSVFIPKGIQSVPGCPYLTTALAYASLVPPLPTERFPDPFFSNGEQQYKAWGHFDPLGHP